MYLLVSSLGLSNTVYYIVIMDKKINVKSSTIEKSLEIAKSFLDRLVMPAVEETGLLVKDHITMWRFKNQVKMINSAKVYCEKHKINPKKISLKVLSPLLEYSSLEEDKEMQDKWSILLSNLIDSEQNIENHVFPYILSQLSKDEFFPLEKIYDNRILRSINQTKELHKFQKEKIQTEKEFSAQIEEIQDIITAKKEAAGDSWNHWDQEAWKLGEDKRKLEMEIRNLEYQESRIRYSIHRQEVIPEDLFREFEFSNLVRLGLIKEVKEFYAESQTLEIPNDRDYNRSYINVDLDIDVDSTTEYILTELGELFFKACKEKNEL